MAVARRPGEHSPYCDGALGETYDRLTVRLQFAAPAGDLVAAVRVRAGDRVLDVGTGTGPAAAAAAKVVGAEGMVVGVDPSLEMLGRLRGKATARVAAARAPDLPFRTSCFDAVIANFVLIEGVLLRRRLGGDAWQLFRQRLAECFRSRFGDSVTYTRNAYIAVGTKQVG